MAAASGACASAICAGTYETTGKHVEFIAAAAVIIGLMAVLDKAVEESDKERPVNPKSELVLESVCWNKDGRAEQGTVYFHCDHGSLTGPPSMVWSAGKNAAAITAVFVPSVLQSLTMQLQVRNRGNTEFHGRLSIRRNGKISESDGFTLAAGASTLVEIVHQDLADFQKPDIREEKDSYALHCSDGKSRFMSRIDYDYFTLLGKPLAPYQLDEGKPYDPENKTYIHTDVLRMIVSQLEQMSVSQSSIVGLTPAQNLIVTAIINLLHNHIRVGYSNNGAAIYSVGFNLVKYEKFLHDIATPNNVYVNCTDCALLTCVKAFQHGIPLHMLMLIGRNGFLCNQIQLIAINNVHQWSNTAFAFHMVNCSEILPDSNQIRVFDACLRLDSGLFPGTDFLTNPNKNPLLPCGMQACEQNSVMVHVPIAQPYAVQVYRERLVRDGCVADFAIHHMNLLLLLPRIQYVPPNAIESCLSMCENITNLSFIGAAGGEYEWRCQYKGSELENCQYTREGVSLEEILSYINCIDREKLSVLNMELWRIGDGSTCVVKKNQELYR